MRTGRPLKRWRYVGVYRPDVMLCIGDAHVAGIRQRWWAVALPDGTLVEGIDDPIAVDIVVDQQELYRYTDLFAKTKGVKSDSTFRLSFKGIVYPHPGKISIIDRAVDPLTGSIRMRLVFPNPENTLRSGMSGTLMVESKVSKSIVIPHKAVNEQLGEFFVYVADSAKATQVKVKLGKPVGKNIIVKEGLAEGDVIITEGIQNLREGTPINIASPNGNAPATPVANKK